MLGGRCKTTSIKFRKHGGDRLLQKSPKSVGILNRLRPYEFRQSEKECDISEILSLKTKAAFVTSEPTKYSETSVGKRPGLGRFRPPEDALVPRTSDGYSFRFATI
jgi:hypothetical protein